MKKFQLSKKTRIILVIFSVGITIISFVVRAIKDNSKDSILAYTLLSVIVCIAGIMGILQVKDQPSKQ